MSQFKLQMDTDSAPVLDRIIEAYGFTSKLQLAIHFDMAASTLSSRYRRGGFPADLVVQCAAETGVTLEWLATGKGKMYENQSVDILRLINHKLIDGEIFEAGDLMIDKVIFGAGIPIPSDPISVQDGKNYYLVDKKHGEVFDGQWLVKIDGRLSIRTLTRMPMQKVRVSGSGMAFDCDLADLTVVGRVVAETVIY